MIGDRVLVQIGTYNANLQANRGLPQNLVDWLAPSLEVSNFLAGSATRRSAPDIVAIGFQELLPLHLGFAGLSQSVIHSRDSLIRTQLTQHAPNNEPYTLVSKITNVGIALFVYARDDTVLPRITDVETQWTGVGPGFMGNKGAVGVKFKVTPVDPSIGKDEVYTFVNAHLTAHTPNYNKRVEDWQQIVSLLRFSSSSSKLGGSIYDSTHLFLLGDFNFRLDHPEDLGRDQLESMIRTQEGRKELIQSYDQLRKAQREGAALQGLREADPWNFQCTYKYVLGHVDKYSSKRIPAWTDRILFASATEQPQSSIDPLLYTSIPAYTTSDHKPVMALLLLPKPNLSSNTEEQEDSETSPLLSRKLTTPSLLSTTTSISQPNLSPSPNWRTKRWAGKFLGWVVGWPWCVLRFLGAGNAIVGVIHFFLGLFGVAWWNRREP